MSTPALTAPFAAYTDACMMLSILFLYLSQYDISIVGPPDRARPYNTIQSAANLRYSYTTLSWSQPNQEIIHARLPFRMRQVYGGLLGRRYDRVCTQQRYGDEVLKWVSRTLSGRELGLIYLDSV